MRYTAMEWYRRANMACLGGGADIVPDEPIVKLPLGHEFESYPDCYECGKSWLEHQPEDPNANND